MPSPTPRFQKSNMDTKEYLLEQLNITVTQLMDVIHRMEDPDIAVYDEWTARDILGHITFWHESFSRNVSDLVRDIKPILLEGSYGELNQRCMKEMRTQTVDVVLKRLESAHRVVRANILNPKLNLIPYKRGSRTYTPEEHLEMVNQHIQRHLRDIRVASKGRL
jgi:hypothetical protein